MMNKVFEKIVVGSMELKNRLMMSAMVTDFSHPDGKISDRFIAYHRERAHGGVALIETEASYIHSTGKGYVNQLGIDRNELIPSLARFVETIHEADAKAMIQLFHAGRRTSPQITGHEEVLGPSSIACFEGEQPPKGMIIAADSGGVLPLELNTDRIGQLVECFALGAKRAKEAGFDAVSIHAGHGYLVSAFLSPFTNKRSDAYGGDLLGRLRFLLEIIEAVRREAGSLPIVVKISGDEFVPGGLRLADTQKMAPHIERAGGDAVIVSAGTVGQSPEEFPSEKPIYELLRSLPMYTPGGSYLHLAKGIKEVVHIPVIAVGRINTPALIREALENNNADMVALGRALLADPSLPRKMEQNGETDIRVCIACNQGCLERLFEQKPITCAVNPRVGREEELKITPAKSSKRVFIAGAGPAGMEAARLLTLRGHKVSLFESKDRLGGQLHLAHIAQGRGEIKHYLDFLLHRIEKLNVQVFTNTEVTPSVIADIDPQVLILATGAKPWIPEFVDSAGNDSIVLAEQVLTGERETGRNTIVAGGGLVGCEVAELLGEQGKRVTIVEMRPDIVEDDFADTKRYFENAIAKYGIDVFVGADIVGIKPKEIVFQTKEGVKQVRIGDTIVLALGYRRDNEAVEALKAMTDARVFAIGDCVRPGKIFNAVSDAYELACSL